LFKYVHLDQRLKLDLRKMIPNNDAVE
jgi:hypothetical protein